MFLQNQNTIISIVTTATGPLITDSDSTTDILMISLFTQTKFLYFNHIFLHEEELIPVFWLVRYRGMCTRVKHS